MRLPKNQLSEAEFAIMQKHITVMAQLQALLLTRQETLNDIIGLALEARSLSPPTHIVDLQTGEIRPKGPQ